MLIDFNIHRAQQWNAITTHVEEFPDVAHAVIKNPGPLWHTAWDMLITSMFLA
jgi:hypothetical protein